MNAPEPLHVRLSVTVEGEEAWKALEQRAERAEMNAESSGRLAVERMRSIQDFEAEIGRLQENKRAVEAQTAHGVRVLEKCNAAQRETILQAWKERDSLKVVIAALKGELERSRAQADRLRAFERATGSAE